jgi:hypothetical protein
MSADTAERLRRDNLSKLQTQNATFIETNTIYAVARKASG